MRRTRARRSAATRTLRTCSILGGPDDSHMHAVLEYSDAVTEALRLQMLKKSVPSGIGVPSEEAGMS